MLRVTVFIGVMILIFSCQSKKVVHESIVDIPIPEQKEISPLEEIRQEIKTLIKVSNDSFLISLYQQRNYQPIWVNETVIEDGLQWIHNIKYHGLNPENYNLPGLISLKKSLHPDTNNYSIQYARLELQLTSTIKKCGDDIRFSRLDPKEFHRSWNFEQPQVLLTDSVWINLIIQDKINSLDQFFEPHHKLYSALKTELKKLYNNPYLGDSTELKYPGFNLYVGDSNKYIAPIKQKLLGVYTDSTNSMLYNEDLQTAIKKFQKQHKLKADGIIGKQTYHFLNWNRDDYISLIKANMERLRWLSDSVLTKGIVINIPAQQTKLYQNDTCLFSAKVIVGKYKHQTQIFQSDINYLVFNPCWTVPRSIATTTILRGAKRDSAYLQKRKMFIYENGVEINPDSIDFNLYSKTSFPFQVFQHTCPQNALGQVKFMFKNKYNIYLHDTPQKSLFKKDIRNFSHGCIRIQYALQLAQTIIQDLDKQQTPIKKHLSKGYPEKVYLNKTIPIKILYLTCWIDIINNDLIYCKDIYLKDYKLIKALYNLQNE